jgi:hypothetical protein
MKVALTMEEKLKNIKLLLPSKPIHKENCIYKYEAVAEFKEVYHLCWVPTKLTNLQQTPRNRTVINLTHLA